MSCRERNSIFIKHDNCSSVSLYLFQWLAHGLRFILSCIHLHSGGSISTSSGSQRQGIEAVPSFRIIPARTIHVRTPTDKTTRFSFRAATSIFVSAFLFRDKDRRRDVDTGRLAFGREDKVTQKSFFYELDFEPMAGWLRNTSLLLRCPLDWPLAKTFNYPTAAAKTSNTDLNNQGRH